MAIAESLPRQTRVQPLDALLVYVEAMPAPSVFSRNPQIGLYYIAQHARDSGFRVQIDTLCSNDRLVERLTRLLREARCPVVGFYVDKDNLWIIRRTVPKLLEAMPALAVVLGGPQATADPEGVLERIPNAVCAAIGEGEHAFLELLRLPHVTSETCQEVSGLAVSTPSGVIRTSPRPPVADLDSLSIPRRHELDIEFDPTVSPALLSGRGCHGSCAFCFEGRVQKSLGHRLRLRDLGRTLEEFDYLVQTYNSRYISIVDDTFVTSPRRVRDFCRALIDRYGGEVKWYCEARVDSLSRHEDLLPLMVQAGLLRVQVGAESGSQAILDAYRKRTTLEQMRTVVENAAASGLLSLFGNFIVGGAFETLRTCQETVEFALELLDRAPGCAAFGSSIFTPYPGTPMTESPEEYNIEIVDLDGVMSIGDQHASCRTKELSRCDILGLRVEFDKQIRDHMRGMLRHIPVARVLEHYTAFAKYQVQTEWYDVSATNRAAATYFSSIANDLAHPWATAALQASSAVFPTRTVDLVASGGERFLVRLWHGAVAELDPLAGTLLELSAGKLSLEEIIALIAQQYPSLPTEVLTQAVATRYADLDASGLIVWVTVR